MTENQGINDAIRAKVRRKSWTTTPAQDPATRRLNDAIRRAAGLSVPEPEPTNPQEPKP